MMAGAGTGQGMLMCLFKMDGMSTPAVVAADPIQAYRPIIMHVSAMQLFVAVSTLQVP